MANYSRKLKIEIDLRRKRKNGEDNRVCGKNEKSVRKGWDSISESTKRNEEASRQRKKESRDMESRRQSDIEYKRLSVQRMTSKKTNRLICQFIYH